MNLFIQATFGRVRPGALGTWNGRLCGRILCGRGELRDADGDELGRLDRRDADLHDDLAGLYHLGCVRFLVALDVEPLLRGGAEQCSLRPRPGEERADVAADALPQRLIVWLKHSP